MSNFNGYAPMPPAGATVQPVKQTAGSVVFLLTTIFYTLLVVMNLVSVFVPNAALTQLLYSVAQLDYSIYDVLPTITSVSSVVKLIAMIPSFLSCIGFWLIFTASRNRTKPTMSTAGLSMVQAVLIIRLILLSIVVVLAAIVMIPLSIALSEIISYYSYGSDYASIASIIVIVVFVLLILVAVLAIIYYAKAIGTASRIKKAASGILPTKKISMYVIVLNFMYVVFGFITLFLSIMSLSLLPFISIVCEIAFYILISIALIQLRGKLNQIETMVMSQTAPYANPYSQPQPVPQPQPQPQPRPIQTQPQKEQQPLHNNQHPQP